MGKSAFPLGYRFHPTDVELVVYYLKRKVMGKKLHSNIISEVDIYKYEPNDLPDKSCLQHGDLKWYFFCPRGRKYGTGERTNRATHRGYWKTTGRDRPVQYRDNVVGMIKTLVYHTGKAPSGDRTDWVMHEYRLQDKDLADPGVLDAFVLCVIFHKDGPGPKNGAQYGAPFKEEEWTDNEEDSFVNPVASANLSTPNFVNPGNSVASTSYDAESLCVVSSCEVQSYETAPSTYKALPAIPENEAMLTTDINGHSPQFPDNNVFTMQDLVTEDDYITSDELTSEKLDEPNCEANTEAGTRPDENDIYSHLEDIEFNDVYSLQNGYMAGFAFDQMLPADYVSFLELEDLETPLFPAKVALTGPRSADGICADLGYYEKVEQSCNTVDTSHGNLHFPGLNESCPLPLEQPPAVSFVSKC